MTDRVFPLHGRCLVEHGLILLDAWITIVCPITGAEPKDITVRFNSVTDGLMQPFVQALRTLPADIGTPDVMIERGRFDWLARDYYKFYSHGRGAIRPGDVVRGMLMQAEMRHIAFALWGGSFMGPASPALLVMLTDTDLILIRDDESQLWLRRAPHGSIRTYIPRALIGRASLSDVDEEMLWLEVGLLGGRAVSSAFSQAAGAPFSYC